MRKLSKRELRKKLHRAQVFLNRARIRQANVPLLQRNGSGVLEAHERIEKIQALIEETIKK